MLTLVLISKSWCLENVNIQFNRFQFSKGLSNRIPHSYEAYMWDRYRAERGVVSWSRAANRRNHWSTLLFLWKRNKCRDQSDRDWDSKMMRSCKTILKNSRFSSFCIFGLILEVRDHGGLEIKLLIYLIIPLITWNCNHVYSSVLSCCLCDLSKQYTSAKYTYEFL